eukprot:461253-Pelagomonas_calceolata.AAC.1
MEGIPGIWKCNVHGVRCGKCSNAFEMAWMSSAWRWVFMRIGLKARNLQDALHQCLHCIYFLSVLRAAGLHSIDGVV